ncbi:hypothetical protein DSS3P8_175 [Roseobacter phage DSS3P8]|nr:hypothetical protein DSS3P8_175 [Roseobacter phage DSS3P8]
MPDHISPTGRGLAAAEERYLREQLSELQRAYQRAAKPYVDRLVELENRKPRIVSLDLCNIDEQVLATLQSKVEALYVPET